MANTDVMIGLFLPPDIANQVALDGGELANDLHITLAYLGDSSVLDPELQANLKTVVTRFAANNPVIEGVISGSGLFAADDEDDKSPLYLSYDSNIIQEFREQLVQSLQCEGINISEDHGFTPHITLKYLSNSDTLMSIRVKPLFIKFNQLTFCWGDERTNFDLLGNGWQVLDGFNSKDKQDNNNTTTFSSPSLLQNAMKVIGDLGSFVMKRGKVFEVGDYPDKNFKITAEEMQEIINDFQSVPLDYEHTAGWLDDKLGYLTNLAMKPGNDKDVFGAIALPHNINQLFGDMPIKLSLTFETKDGKKKVTRAALTANPRVADAIVMSKFSSDVAEVVKDKETISEIEQLDKYVANPVEFIGNRHNVSDKAALWTSHDIIADLLGADCSASNRDDMNNKPVHLGTDNNEGNNNFNTNNPTIDKSNNTTNKENISMSQETKDTDKTVETTNFAEIVEQQAQIIAQLTEERDYNLASNAAKRLVAKNPVLLSAYEEQLTVFLSQAATDDRKDNKPRAITNFSASAKDATFTNKLSRLAFTEALFAQILPDKNYLTHEMIASVQAQGKDPLATFGLSLLPNQQNTPTVDQAQAGNQSVTKERADYLKGLANKASNMSASRAK